jgi:hypothetical protein
LSYGCLRHAHATYELINSEHVGETRRKPNECGLSVVIVAAMVGGWVRRERTFCRSTTALFREGSFLCLSCRVREATIHKSCIQAVEIGMTAAIEVVEVVVIVIEMH